MLGKVSRSPITLTKPPRNAHSSPFSDIQENKRIITRFEFQERKEQHIKDLAYKIYKAKEQRCGFDMDILNAVIAWNRIPFTFTIQCCSGTPGDHSPHDKYSTRPLNFSQVPPHGWLMAHSLSADSHFDEFRTRLKQIEGITIVSDEHLGADRTEGINFHYLRFWVPEKIHKENKDLRYLNRCWGKLERFLKKFYGSYRHDFYY